MNASSSASARLDIQLAFRVRRLSPEGGGARAGNAASVGYERSILVLGQMPDMCPGGPFVTVGSSMPRFDRCCVHDTRPWRAAGNRIPFSTTRCTCLRACSPLAYGCMQTFNPKERVQREEWQ